MSLTYLLLEEEVLEQVQVLVIHSLSLVVVVVDDDVVVVQ